MCDLSITDQSPTPFESKEKKRGKKTHTSGFCEMGWLLVVLLVASGVAASSAPRMCPVELDSAAAKLIETEVVPVFRSHGASLPFSCPFHASHDRMALVRQSRAIGPARHRCAFCGGEEKTQESLLAHVLANHTDRVSSSASSCFSDFCVMLGCAPLERAELRFELHKCQDVVASCVPEDKKNTDLRSALAKKFCARFVSSSSGVGEEAGGAGESLAVLKYLGLAFGAVFLVVFYILLLLWRQESSFSDDLESSFFRRIWRMLKRGRKQKGY